MVRSLKFLIIITLGLTVSLINNYQAFGNTNLKTTNTKYSCQLKPKRAEKSSADKGILNIQVGNASWYGPNFHGKKTASGAIYNQYEYTAAHPTLPLLSVAKVTNLSNKRSILVVINDRGPYVGKQHNRIIDLSRKAAYDLDIINLGIAKVKVEYLPRDTIVLQSKINKKITPLTKSRKSQELVKQVAFLNFKSRERT